MSSYQRQNENFAKFLYDIAKLTFAGLVIGAVISKEPNFGIIIAGLFLTALQAGLAFWIDFRRGE